MLFSFSYHLGHLHPNTHSRLFLFPSPVVPVFCCLMSVLLGNGRVTRNSETRTPLKFLPLATAATIACYFLLSTCQATLMLSPSNVSYVLPATPKAAGHLSGRAGQMPTYVEARTPLAQSLKMNGINGVEQGALQTPM